LISGVLLEDGRSAAFRGIPFAAPPVGNLRWREPMPVVPWDGVRQATRPGPAAAQPALGWNDDFAKAGSEDCLYLDVWTPSPGAGGRLPVMVWVHGGANVAGAGGFDPLYDGRQLIRKGVVLVVVEYRLGVFGFYSHPELTAESPHHASGNYGLMDQAAALRWVHDNISRFGGDPGNVTLFGQSAGSMDVVALMTSPLARGLFHRAIAESGPTLYSWTAGAAEREGIRAAAAAGAPATGSVAFLRSLPAEALLRKMPWMMAGSTDGWVLPENPGDAFREGKEARIPLIIGSMAIEIPDVGTPEVLRQHLADFFGEERARRAEVHYGLAAGGKASVDPLYGDAAEQWGSDGFRCRAVVQGEWHARAGNPTWEYEFDRAIPRHPHALHSGDLPYVFGNLLRTGSQSGEFQEEDRRLSAEIMGYWTRFASTGDPNGGPSTAWPRHDATTRKYMVFGAAGEVRIAENERGPECDLFREVMGTTAAGR